MGGGSRPADVGILSFLDEGLIRVRFSYDGPLKEDKKGSGKVKWVPAPEDCAAFRGPWLAARKAQGAGPEDRVFACTRRKGLCYRKEFIEACWEEAAPKHVGAREVLLKKKGDKIANEEKPTMTWYQATRHSFVSRHLCQWRVARRGSAEPLLPWGTRRRS